VTERLEIKALPITIRNVYYSIIESPIRGPYPRLGSLIGVHEAEIPHFIKDSTRETIDQVDPSARFGMRVVVYTQGDMHE
jgi:hypothetical protein